MKKLFCFYCGLLSESLKTTIEVSGLSELVERVTNNFGNRLINIRILNDPKKDPRLSEEWGDTCYYVVADIDGYTGQCIGMSNFYENSGSIN